ncbi:MAG: hypothetical protein ACXQS4_00660 [Methermicoccaceae archaeon]
MKQPPQRAEPKTISKTTPQPTHQIIPKTTPEPKPAQPKGDVLLPLLLIGSLIAVVMFK